MRRASLACWLIAAIALGAPAAAQERPPAPAPSCPSAAEVTQRDLLGLWRAQFDGLPQGATLLLEPNPNWAGSLSGAVNRDGAHSRLAGDVDGGEFTLEESADGVRIDATWLGDVVEGSCGREIRGTWQAEGGKSAHHFVLRRVGDL